MNIRIILCGISVALASAAPGQGTQEPIDILTVKGLAQPVEIVRDRWGIAHIYAQNQKDLFFAQGFNIASDRLFQLEIWRRQATGTLAEILGRRALKRDIGARLLKFREDLREELNFYHPQGEEIITSFVCGINAYVDLTRKNPELLPFEFQLLGLKPGHWTPEVVISRHNGLFRNVGDEVSLARAVLLMGAEKLEDLLDLHPGSPSLKPADGLDLALISSSILELYREARSPVQFEPEDIVGLPVHSAPAALLNFPRQVPTLNFPLPQASPLPPFLSSLAATLHDLLINEENKFPAPLPSETVSQRHCEGAEQPKQSHEVIARSEATWRSQPQDDEIPRCARDDPKGRIASLLKAARNDKWQLRHCLSRERESPLFHLSDPVGRDSGSNNWAVSGRLTRNGRPLLASDPHRALQVPSLRYWVHLVAPGWNVIGGGEPALPGVSIGHNEFGAWGLTIFSADQEDLYVYETNPSNPNQYKYGQDWEEMKLVQEDIAVKGEQPYEATLKFTRHGPVLSEDLEKHRACALRAAWLETGCAPYLTSLRLDQACTWPEFRSAAFANRTPSENIIWADRSGTIGWQATGLTPIRKDWPGLLPIPGDGRYEWSGFIPAADLPSLLNPDSGFVATANQDNLPLGYLYQVGYIWADPFRYLRVSEFLSSGKKWTLEDMAALQQDFLSIPARLLVPLLKPMDPKEPSLREAQRLLQEWDFVLSPESAAAAVYVAWQRALLRNLNALLFPEEVRTSLPARSLMKAIRRLKAPDEHFGSDPAAARDRLLLGSLREAVAFLQKTFGPDVTRWRYGDAGFHHVRLRHPLSRVVKDDVRRLIDLGPLPRGGNGETVNNTSGVNNQASGATFRIIADLSDWDRTLGTNAPGQSGDPKNPHYSDLFRMWAEGRYFPVYFSRAKIQSAAEKTTVLRPVHD